MFLKNIQELGIETNSQKQVEYGKKSFKRMPKFKSHFKREEITKCVGFGRGKKVITISSETSQGLCFF